MPVTKRWFAFINYYFLQSEIEIALAAVAVLIYLISTNHQVAHGWQYASCTYEWVTLVYVVLTRGIPSHVDGLANWNTNTFWNCSWFFKLTIIFVVFRENAFATYCHVVVYATSFRYLSEIINKNVCFVPSIKKLREWYMTSWKQRSVIKYHFQL